LALLKVNRRPSEWKPVESLSIDKENFRFDKKVNRSQRELIHLLERDYQLEQIGESLADNGYFAQEPLVGIKQGNDIIIVEGNRRLAALKLLLFPSLRVPGKDNSFWGKLAGRMKYDLREVPVVIFRTRAQLTSYLGYRHVASTIPWQPLPKARFIAELVEKRGSFEEVSNEIGCPASVVRKNYIAYKAYLQAKQKFRIDTSRVDQNFSVFFRALGYTQIADYVGLKADRTLKALRNPIPSSKRSRLNEVITYVHGTEDEPKVLPESRDLRRLGEILTNEKARSVLESSGDFYKAYSYAGGETRKLTENLQRASTSLDEALVGVHRHVKDERVIALVKEIIGTLTEILKYFPDIKVTTN